MDEKEQNATKQESTETTGTEPTDTISSEVTGIDTEIEEDN